MKMGIGMGMKEGWNSMCGVGRRPPLAYSRAVHRKLSIYKDAFFVVTEDTTSLYNLRGRIPMVWWLTCL